MCTDSLFPVGERDFVHITLGYWLQQAGPSGTLQKHLQEVPPWFADLSEVGVAAEGADDRDLDDLVRGVLR